MLRLMDWRLDDHKLGIFGIFYELFLLTVVVLMSTFKTKSSLKTFKTKNSLKTIEAEILKNNYRYVHIN